jgi:peptide/nickel transport system substrate-binding protein
MQRVVVVFMDEDAALAAARAGQVDIVYTSALYAEQNVPGFELLTCTSVDSRGISLPCAPAGGTRDEAGSAYAAGNAATSDLALRRAMSYGLDRELMVQHVLAGYGTAAYSVCDGMPWACEDMRVPTSAAEAALYLTEGGWQAGSDGVLVRSQDGQRAAFDLWYPAGDSVREALAAEFGNQMAGLGIAVTPRSAGWDELYLHQYSDPILWGWGSNSPVEV